MGESRSERLEELLEEIRVLDAMATAAEMHPHLVTKRQRELYAARCQQIDDELESMLRDLGPEEGPNRET